MITKFIGDLSFQFVPNSTETEWQVSVETKGLCFSTRTDWAPMTTCLSKQIKELLDKNKTSVARTAQGIELTIDCSLLNHKFKLVLADASETYRELEYLRNKVQELEASRSAAVQCYKLNVRMSSVRNNASEFYSRTFPAIEYFVILDSSSNFSINVPGDIIEQLSPILAHVMIGDVPSIFHLKEIQKITNMRLTNLYICQDETHTEYFATLAAFPPHLFFESSRIDSVTLINDKFIILTHNILGFVDQHYILYK